MKTFFSFVRQKIQQACSFVLWRGASLFFPRLLLKGSFNKGLYLLSRFQFSALTKLIIQFSRTRLRLPAIKLRISALELRSSFKEFLGPSVVRAENEKVSFGVVIVTHQDSTFLTETLESIQNQTTVPSRVILVISGDAKFHRSVIKQIKLSRIPNFSFLLTDSQPAGLNRNLGATRINTDYIIFVDGDDVLKPKAVEIFCANLSTNRYHALGSSCALFPKKSIYHVLPLVRHVDLKSRNQLQVPAAIKVSDFLQINGFRSSGIFHEHQPEDWDFWFRFTSIFGSFENVRDVLHKYRIHDRSTSYLENNLRGEKDEYWQYAINTQESVYWESYTCVVSAESSKPPALIRKVSKLLLVDSVEQLDEVLEKNPGFLENQLRAYVLFGSATNIHNLEEKWDDKVSIFNLTSSFVSFQLGLRYFEEYFEAENILFTQPKSRIKRISDSFN
jgi:glycosyltransferase involved in cell wall biosynthesis